MPYCSQCGQLMRSRMRFGRKRPVCPSCERVHFENPKVATGVVAERRGRIVLTRRGHDPMLGRWSFPSGFVDAGEMVEEAAAREVEEETGLVVSITRLLGVYSARGERTVFVAYAGVITSGVLRAGEEALEVAYFPPDQLPELAFPHDSSIISAWRAGRPARSRRAGG